MCGTLHKPGPHALSVSSLVGLRALWKFDLSSVERQGTRAGATHANSGAVRCVAARHGVVQGGDVGDDGLLIGVRDVDV